MCFNTSLNNRRWFELGKKLAKFKIVLHLLRVVYCCGWGNIQGDFLYHGWFEHTWVFSVDTLAEVQISKVSFVGQIWLASVTELFLGTQFGVYAQLVWFEC